MAKRLAGRFGYPADDPFRVTLHPDRLDQPLRWRKPRRVFVCSMGDLFHEDVHFRFIEMVWRRMVVTDRHTYQILTKRPRRLFDFYDYWRKGPDFDFEQPNLWLGVSAENQATANKRIPILLNTPAAVRFVSVEPMLESVDLTAWMNPDPELYYATGPELNWVIIGCESGPGRRPMELEWAVDLVNQCQEAGVPAFVKQLPIDGKVSHDPSEWPKELRVREYPA
jgi:protein gp37